MASQFAAGAAAAAPIPGGMAAATESKEEQALRAQALAEKCFLAGNLFGARQWMQSAARLAPGLPGTAQIVAAYDVHIAGARKPPDWYAVLGLRTPGAAAGPITHDDIKRQHRRLCLLVHPDKNPCAAADGAFKLVQAAWHELSARHPPGAPAAHRQPKARQPEPPPRPRPRPTVVQMPRRPAPPTPTAPGPAPAPRAPSYAPQAAEAPKKPPRKGRWVKVSGPSGPQRSTSPIADKCPSCGARANGKKTFRCMSCQWSAMDERPRRDDDDYDDYCFDYDYY